MKTSGIMIFLLFLVNTSCKQIKEKLLPAFTVNIPDIKLSIPPIPFKQNKELPVGALKAHINMDSTIRANTAGTFGADAVSFVKIKKITFLVANANATNSLANFESGRMRIYSDNDTAAIDIASVKFPLAYSDSFTIVPTDNREISNYLRGSELHYNIFWKNRRTTTKRLNLTIRVSLNVQ
jgi:hypothetical protein